MDLTDNRVVLHAEIVRALHENWTPHSGQIRVGKALLSDGIKDVFVEAGRNWGKTELVIYLLWRWAAMYPGSENYYFAPFQKQGNEILWDNQRLPGFGPRHWLLPGPSGVNNTDSRLNFKNGSFIKVDGSDNVESYRGVKPRGLIIYDEFKDFRPEFHIAFDPNRAAFDPPLLIIGTPPDRDCQFSEMAKEYKANPSKRYFQAPSSENPHIPRKWLENKKTELYAKGEGDVWEREYEAKFVKGGASKIFPMVSERMIKPHDAIVKEILRDRKKLEWILWADPGAATCFGVLFVAINPFTKKIYVLDEIYETDQAKMSVKQVGQRLIQKRDEHWDRGEWRQGYDEAETWFCNEMIDNFQEAFEPSHKAHSDKEAQLSLTKDIMLAWNLVISDRCQKFYWELDNYFKDKNGKIPKLNDHLIDCWRYILHATNYELKTSEEYLEKNDENFRGAKISQDFPSLTDSVLGSGLTISNWDKFNE